MKFTALILALLSVNAFSAREENPNSKREFAQSHSKLIGYLTVTKDKKVFCGNGVNGAIPNVRPCEADLNRDALAKGAKYSTKIEMGNRTAGVGIVGAIAISGVGCYLAGKLVADGANGIEAGHADLDAKIIGGKAAALVTALGTTAQAAYISTGLGLGPAVAATLGVCVLGYSFGRHGYLSTVYYFFSPTKQNIQP